MKKKRKIPKFKTLEEEAHFWDTHSFVDFEGEMEDVEIVFDLKKAKTESVAIRFPKPLKEKLTRIARQKGLNPSTLARMWIIEKLSELTVSRANRIADKK